MSCIYNKKNEQEAELSSPCKTLLNEYGPYRVEFCDFGKTIAFKTYDRSLLFYKAGFEKKIREMLLKVMLAAYGPLDDGRISGEYWITADALAPWVVHGMIFVKHAKQNFLLKVNIDPRTWDDGLPEESYLLGSRSYPRYVGLDGNEIDLILADNSEKRMVVSHLSSVAVASKLVNASDSSHSVKKMKYITGSESIISRMMAFDFTWDLKDISKK